MKLIQQIEYCKQKGLPMFAPEDGKCWSCKNQIEDSGTVHITGCQHCCRSFCD